MSLKLFTLHITCEGVPGEVGPFVSWDNANRWAERAITEHGGTGSWHVVSLHPPGTAADRLERSSLLSDVAAAIGPTVNVFAKPPEPEVRLVPVCDPRLRWMRGY